MYKDPEKQKEAAKLAMRKKRQGITKGITKSEGITSGITEGLMIRGEHGGSIPLRLLTEPGWVKLIKYLHEDLGKRKSFRGGCLEDEVRIGVEGVVVGDAHRMVEVIG